VVEEKKESDDARREQLFQARKRGIIALVVTVMIGVAAFLLYRGTVDLPGTRDCKTTSECEGLIGVECLHAPTSTYCTHSCNRNEDCDQGMHCESPPWEKNTTRALCLKDIAPPAK
jgi:hypothetical protein